MKLDENHKRFNTLLNLIEETGGLTGVELIQRGVVDAGADAKHLAKLGILKLKEPQGIWEFSDYGNKLNLKKGKLSYWEYHHKLENSKRNKFIWDTIIKYGSFLLSVAAIGITLFTDVIMPKSEQKAKEKTMQDLIHASDSGLHHYVDSSLNKRFDSMKNSEVKPAKPTTQPTK